METQMIGEPEHLFIDRQYLRDINKYVRRGKIKIKDDRYKYSTKNIQLPFTFEIEELFREENSSTTKLKKQFFDFMTKRIKDYAIKRNSDSQQNFYYNRHNEFMHLDDFLEFYNKFLEKRKEENEKLHYKRKFANEVVKIRKIKTKKFMETETLKMKDKKISEKDKKKLNVKLKKFIGGLDYALDKLNYQQAEKMLRKLNTVPQPPLQSSLGVRTRLYTIKTGGNLDRALSRILEERKASGLLKVPSEEETRAHFRKKMKKHGTKYGQILKRRMHSRIQASMDKIDHFLTNKPVRKRGKSRFKMSKMRSSYGMRRVRSLAPKKRKEKSVDNIRIEEVKEEEVE